MVKADVAAPDDPRAGVAHGVDQPGRLRVMEDDDVLRRDELCELAGVVGERVFVDLVFGLPERTPVAVEPVQAVVDALGQREELGTA